MKHVVICSMSALLLAGSSLAAPLPKELRNRNDAELIVGRWRLECTSIDGEPMSDESHRDLIIQFDAKGMRSITNNGEALSRGKYSLDLSTVPHRLQWRSVGGDELVCIYELNGDSLLLAFIRNDAAIPKQFLPAENITIYKHYRLNQ